MIRYSEGYKYQLEALYACETPVTGTLIEDDLFTLYESGLLVIRKGFAWDGASGPTFDSKSSMRASLVHDVFCICMRDGRLPYEKWQDTVNEFFRQQCIEDGMWAWRAGLWHAAVELADAGNPDQGRDRVVLTAP
jgi:hypothetical protein